MNLLLFFLFGIAGLVVVFLTYPYWRKPASSDYSGFGIRIPGKYTIHGIDVSRYQGNINWPMVAAMEHQNKQLKFAFIKASQGIALPDPYFKRNWKEAKAAGLMRGAYFYFHPSSSPEAQAQLFTTMVGDLSYGDFRPVVDIECEGHIGCEKIQQNLQVCLDHLEHRYGVKPIIYTNADYYKNYLKDKFNDYPLWVAHYHGGETPHIERDWHFWQHSDRGTVDGIKHRVDFNVFNGTMDDLRKYCIRP